MPAPKLLDQVRTAMRLKHAAIRTETAYVQWVKRSILFHTKRHPNEMGGAEVEAFLTHLAGDEHVSASTHNQALSALLLRYQEVLHTELGTMDSVRARTDNHVPSVLTMVLDGTTNQLPSMLLRIEIRRTHREWDDFHAPRLLQKCRYGYRCVPGCPIPEQQNELVRIGFQNDFQFHGFVLWQLYSGFRAKGVAKTPVPCTLLPVPYPA